MLNYTSQIHIASHQTTISQEGGGGGGFTEVALDLKKRTKQELAVPAVVHFYLWLLQVRRRRRFELHKTA